MWQFERAEGTLRHVWAKPVRPSAGIRPGSQQNAFLFSDLGHHPAPVKIIRTHGQFYPFAPLQNGRARG